MRRRLPSQKRRAVSQSPSANTREPVNSTVTIVIGTYVQTTPTSPCRKPLKLKGKSEPVPAHRLVSVLDTPERSHVSRFVGREREIAEIARVWERARAQTRCELVTVVGDVGGTPYRAHRPQAGPLSQAR